MVRVFGINFKRRGGGFGALAFCPIPQPNEIIRRYLPLVNRFMQGGDRMRFGGAVGGRVRQDRP